MEEEISLKRVVFNGRGKKSSIRKASVERGETVASFQSRWFGQEVGNTFQHPICENLCNLWMKEF